MQKHGLSGHRLELLKDLDAVSTVKPRLGHHAGTTSTTTLRTCPRSIYLRKRFKIAASAPAVSTLMSAMSHQSWKMASGRTMLLLLVVVMVVAMLMLPVPPLLPPPTSFLLEFRARVCSRRVRRVEGRVDPVCRDRHAAELPQGG